MKLKRFTCLLLTLVMCLSTMPITAMADDPPEAAPHQYLSNISIAKTMKDSTQVYLYAESLNAELTYDKFSFDPLVTEYDIMLVDANVDTVLTMKATLNDAQATPSARITDADGNYITGTGFAYKSGAASAAGMMFVRNSAISTLKMDTKAPATIKHVTGDLTSGAVNQPSGVLSNTVTYTFNFYRKATLASFAVAYENGTAITEGIPSKFDPYLNNYEVTGVAAGTDQLVITAPAFTPTDTALKFDDGSGSYIAGDSDTTFTLDLTKYQSGQYKQADGSVIIPFKLDYTGAGCGVDGYYTLKVSFAEKTVDYTPVLKSVSSDAEVTIGADDLTLSVAVDPLDSDSDTPLSYQWYSSDTSNGEYKKINGATNPAYTPSTDVSGTTYYTCEVTRTAESKDYTKTTDPIKVTVKKESSGEGEQSGFVKNITFRTSSGAHVFLDNFKPDVTCYNLLIPYQGTIYPLYTMPLELANSDTEHTKKMQYSAVLKDSDGKTVRTYSSKFNSNSVVDLCKMDNGSAQDWRDRANGFFRYLQAGEYTLEIKVYAEDNPEKGDQYVFHIILAPYLSSLTVLSGEKQLITAPDVSKEISATTREIVQFTREYNVTTPGKTDITLKGTMQTWLKYDYPGAPSASFYYDGEDKTADFTGSGVTIDLTKCEKNGDRYTVPFSILFGETGAKTRSDYKLYVTAGQAAGWEITGQPQGGTYDKGDKVTLSVTVEGEKASNVTYQWQWSSNAAEVTNNRFDHNIENATGPSLTVPTGSAGRRFYRCVVTDKNTGVFQNSAPAAIDINLGQVNKPVIASQPGKNNGAKTEYIQGTTIENIQMTAGTTDEKNQDVFKSAAKVDAVWYYNNTASVVGAKLLDSVNYETSSTYTLGATDGCSFVERVCAPHFSYKVTEKLDVGDHFFYCVVTASAIDNCKNTASVTSDFVKITIKAREGIDGFDGKGTENDPYVVKTADQLKKIGEMVSGGDSLSGAVFQFANDVTLPLDWVPIGKNLGGNGPNLRAFSGTIDGGGYTLTVAKGGKPLLNLTRDAVVKNLKIFGEEINGAGLLDKVIVDYGEDGVYQQYTDPDVITMENVTLKEGSKTRGSGLANGGYNSGINDIFVKNCTIEKGVVVGYTKDKSDIASFVGTLNGRIENSVSYAAVYGISNVGGLAGKKGQSIGVCEIVNSAFLGTIVATGGKVGGIIGAGYISESAPNTPPITVRNCYVAADITGNSTADIEVTGYDSGSGIGGIAGSEIGLRGAWNEAYISDNHFCGTITDTNPDAGTRYSRVGGILGDTGGYDPKLLTYENNYYLGNDNYAGIGYQLNPNTNWDPNKNSFIAKSGKEFSDGTVFNLLMGGKNSFKNWMQEQNTPYPVHDPNAKPRIYAMKISGNYKDIYYVGEELDTTGIKLTALYTITGAEVEVDLKDAVFSGFDTNVADNQNVTVTYGGVSTTFSVSVIRRYDDGGGSKDKTISVKFALIGSTMSDGDIDLGNKKLLYRGASYKTWIGLTEYKMGEGATVLELFDRALKQANMPYTITAMNNYVDSISGLAEFTNGPRSGWMYTVGKKDDGSDGSHPNLGLRQYELNDGDVIIWHYVDDYSYEVPDWNEIGGKGYPALGDGTYYSLWLKALTSGSYTPPAGVGDATDSGTVLNPKVTAQNGAALVTVNGSDISKAIEDAKKNSTRVITIEPQITGAAAKTSVQLPKASVSSMASDTSADLKIVTPIGGVTIPNDVLASVASQALGNTVTVVAEAVKTNTLSTEQQKLVGGGTVFDISILSGEKHISSFGGKSITISLPYKLQTGESTDGVTVWYLSDEGKLERMSCTYDAKTGLATFTTTHLSNYVVGYDAWQNPFTDVKTGDWFYDAVKYAVQNERYNGTSATTFGPRDRMTRAMLVTVLYGLEGKPLVTGKTAFTDVKDGEWYTDAVIWANANGITTGYGNGLFGTKDAITREQMAAMLLSYANYKKLDTKKTTDLAAYTDAASIAPYALDAMKWAKAEGFLTGRTTTTIAPADTATRAEAATILMRFEKDYLK